GVLAQARVRRKVAGKGSDGRYAVRTAALRNREVGRITLRNGQIIEVHLILDQEFFPVPADEAAQPVVLRRAEADFMALVSALYRVVPVADGCVAGFRLGR